MVVTGLYIILTVVVSVDKDKNIVGSGVRIVNDSFDPFLTVRYFCQGSPWLTIRYFEISALIGLVAKVPTSVYIADT